MLLCILCTVHLCHIYKILCTQRTETHRHTTERNLRFHTAGFYRNGGFRLRKGNCCEYYIKFAGSCGTSGCPALSWGIQISIHSIWSPYGWLRWSSWGISIFNHTRCHTFCFSSDKSRDCNKDFPCEAKELHVNTTPLTEWDCKARNRSINKLVLLSPVILKSTYFSESV